MNIDEYRQKIDEIDRDIVRLFKERMDISKKIGEYKIKNNLPVKDPKRERELLEKLSSLAGEEYENGIRALYSLVLDLSRSYQSKLAPRPEGLSELMNKAVENTSDLFPEKAVVACQGADGAYSHAAAEKVFKYPSIMFFSSFEGVFAAVDKGLCRFGILPLENSTAGSVNQIYDLMVRYNFSIVRTARIRVSHVLLASKGSSLSDIKEIYSHQQAILQCDAFLSSLKGVKVIPCENTAIAARRVAESGRNDVAAISSGECADIYGLDIIKDNISDEKHNYTRFICISKTLEIYPGADKTSIMMVIPHKSGSLYKVLSRLYILGINLNKLESRPIPDRSFEFMFYFDIDESIYSPKLQALLTDLEAEFKEFRYLGSYSEVI